MADRVVLQNITLKGFAGTFEVHIQDPERAGVYRSVTKTCSFSPSQYICKAHHCRRRVSRGVTDCGFVFVACSSNGTMTVVVDLSSVVQSGVNPARTSLLHKNCRPKESDSTRVLYSFSLNSCGNTVKVGLACW